MRLNDYEAGSTILNGDIPKSNIFKSAAELYNSDDFLGFPQGRFERRRADVLQSLRAPVSGQLKVLRELRRDAG